MELDLLAAAETESDSESNHSNQDNASGRRSVVTAATAGSEAGMLPSSSFLAYTKVVCEELVKLCSVRYSQRWLTLFLKRCFSRDISEEEYYFSDSFFSFFCFIFLIFK